MADGNSKFTPATQVPGIDPTKTADPFNGAGLNIAQDAIDNDHLFQGVVCDSYASVGVLLVNVYNYKKNFPCIPLKSAVRGLFGAFDGNLPKLMDEVLIYVPSHGRHGIIIGHLETVQKTQTNKPCPQLIPGGGVTTYSEQEAWFPSDWNVEKMMPAAGSGAAVDAIPGDKVFLNDFNCAMGVLRIMALLKGSELAKIEAYCLDDLLRIVGHNLQEFTSAGERRVAADFDRVSDETVASETLHESLGAKDKGEDIAKDNGKASIRTDPDMAKLEPKQDRPTGRWRFRSLKGYFGGFLQRFILRPNQAPGSMANPSGTPDAGMFHEYLGASGEHFTRSIVGGGIIKGLQIAVPKRQYNQEDPEGDAQVTESPVEDFQFSNDPGTPMGIGCQVRDYLAWLFNKRATSRLVDYKKDWDVPDESKCPAPGSAPSVPGLGSFFREFPKEEDAMGAFSDYVDESGVRGKKFRVGESFFLLLEDGSAMVKDSWGSVYEMRGGHIIQTASKDIIRIAGGSIIDLAGDDYIVKAYKSMDFSTTKKQIRMKAGSDVYVHANNGGIQFTAPNESSISLKDGEQGSVSGIVFKTAAGIEFRADSAFFNLDSQFSMRGAQDGSGITVVEEISTKLTKMDGSHVIKTGDDYIMLSNGAVYCSQNVQSNGSVYASKNVQADGNGYFRGSVEYGGSQGTGDFSKTPHLPNIADTAAGSFDGFESYQYYYSFQQLEDIKFTFRSSQEAATVGGKWFESQWQRDLGGLQAWKEEEVNGTYPYPGAATYNSNCYYKYKEGNVDLTGKPKSRTAMSKTGGKFSPGTFSTLQIHPDR